MYTHQKSLNFIENQCLLLKERIDRGLGHTRTQVRSRSDCITISVAKDDVAKLARMGVPSRIGNYPIRFHIQGEKTVKKARRKGMAS